MELSGTKRDNKGRNKEGKNIVITNRWQDQSGSERSTNILRKRWGIKGRFNGKKDLEKQEVGTHRVIKRPGEMIDMTTINRTSTMKLFFSSKNGNDKLSRCENPDEKEMYL